MFMKEQIQQRIALWKRIFAEGNDQVDENSSWLEILLAQNFGYDETVQRYTKAQMNYGCFTAAETGALDLRPHYSEALDVLNNMMFTGDILTGSTPLQDGAILRLYLCNIGQRINRAVSVYEVQIVTDKPVILTDEEYMFFDGGNALSSRNVVLRYTTS